jgi:hypothetical protein
MALVILSLGKDNSKFGGEFDPAMLAALGKQVAPPIEDAFVDAAHLAGRVATGFVLLGLVLSLLLPKDSRHTLAHEAEDEPEDAAT